MVAPKPCRAKHLSGHHRPTGCCADQYNEDPVCKALSLGLGLLGVRPTVDPSSRPATDDATGGKKTD